MIDFTRSGQTNDQTEQANGLSLSPLQSLVQQIVEAGRLITPLAINGGLVKIGKLQLDPLPHQRLRRAGPGKAQLQLGDEPAEHLPAGGFIQHVAGQGRLHPYGLAGPLGLHRLEPSQLLLLFTAAAALALAGMVWLLARGERERDPLLRAWHRLGRRYARLGLGRAPHEPALAWAERVSAAHPRTGQTLLALSQRFADARYAGLNGGTRQLVEDLRRHRP